MRLNVERASGRVTEIDVPDNATATAAAMLVADVLDYGVFDGPWRIGIGQDEGKVSWLRLSQTVADLVGPDVFLTIEPGGVSRWN